MWWNHAVWGPKVFGALPSSSRQRRTWLRLLSIFCVKKNLQEGLSIMLETHKNMLDVRSITIILGRWKINWLGAEVELFFMHFYVKSSEFFQRKNMLNLKENKYKVEEKKIRMSRWACHFLSSWDYSRNNKSKKKDEKI